MDPAESMFPPELSILRPGEGALSNMPFPFAPPEDFPPSLNNRPWEQIDYEDHQDDIAHSVQCEDTKMVVSIEKETLKVSKTYNLVCNIW